MNISEKEERLKGILEHNIKNEKIGTAIAITGPWGVGKTFFWKSFLDKQLSNERIYTDDNVFNRKYAYVSLFGLESLSDLKTQIYSNIESFHSSVEIPKWIKGLPSIFKDSRVTQLGISAPVKLIDNLMFNRVNDAIICFDDFERMSNKLDIKDVMGLANYLKLEKNCQVILILDEDKAEGDNKKKYADYKEKLIDETIVINSVEPLIRENAKDIDEALVNLMIDFADKLDIHNFRFFQKVIKLYRDFRKSLPEVVADSTKEIILVRILQGYLIHDFKKLEYDWNDCQYYSERKKENWSSIKKLTYDNLREISYFFIKDDLWLIEFKKWFEQKDDFSNEALIKLAQSELISDFNNKLRDKLSALLDERDNYQASDDFIDRLYSISCQSIGISSLPDLRACISTLEDFEESEKANLLESKVISWIKEKLSKDRNAFKGSGLFGVHGFESIIQEFLKLNPNMPPLKDAIYHIYINNAYSDLDLESIRNADKSSLNCTSSNLI
ncbi:P-loop NTPase fold protein [Acinetobacter haemolyticus]|uniref:P-loop NTPase fold protein n=1 Tax=Acinetobacter haemolyticus TaxID=29430 RepID=UPI000E13344C|nr:P-loop NTPase fold protein [Acinetobacter haemolyticus]SUU09243.1 KAP family P-loop domain-containing protein [Acinetobacter haemolyticus]